MKYKHIVFDIDGTLIDTEYAVLHSLQETIKELSGRKIPCSELRFALGITGTDALKKLEIKDTSYAIELWDKNMRNYTNTIKVFDGIVELLKNLLSLDYKMGIVTSKTREEFTHDFCPFGISHYFKTIICADDTQEHKPNAAPILKYMELSKTDNSKVLYIGDSKYDSKCAENAGIDFALAVWGSHNKHIKADYFFDEVNLEESDLLFLPGGPGHKSYMENEKLLNALKEHDKKGKRIAAICAAPSILGRIGLLKGKKATCFPGFEKYLDGAQVLLAPVRVVTDGNITTSRGMGTSVDLGLEIVKLLISEEKAKELAASTQYAD